MVTLLSSNPKRGVRSKKSSAAHSGACTPGVAPHDECPGGSVTLSPLAIVSALEALQLADAPASVGLLKPHALASGADALRTSGTSTPVTCSSCATPPPLSPPLQPTPPQTPPILKSLSQGKAPDAVGPVRQRRQRPAKANPMFIPKHIQRRGMNIPVLDKPSPSVVVKLEPSPAHMQLVSGDFDLYGRATKFQCSADLLCNRIFVNAKALAHHERMHSYLLNHEKKDWPPGTAYFCPFGCGIPFFVHGPFKLHLERFHPLALEDFAGDEMV